MTSKGDLQRRLDALDGDRSGPEEITITHYRVGGDGEPRESQQRLRVQLDGEGWRSQRTDLSGKV